MTDREMALMLYGALSAVVPVLSESYRSGTDTVLTIATEYLWDPTVTFKGLEPVDVNELMKGSQE